MSDRRQVQFSIRLPPELYEKVAADARREHRSLNAQILTVLELTLTRIATQEASE